jgi:hypothetical protein
MKTACRAAAGTGRTVAGPNGWSVRRLAPSATAGVASQLRFLASPYPGGVCQLMIVLEIALLALLLCFFWLMDRYAAGCEHL